jgi:soluble lytic murein transglycosylase
MVLILLITLNLFAATKPAKVEPLFGLEKLELSRSDLIIGENIVSMMKLIDKGYINQEILNKLLAQTEGSKNFKPFLPWLRAVKEISHLKNTKDLTLTCDRYAVTMEKFPLEKRLERIAGNYCRERTLEAIGRDIEKDNSLTDDSLGFIQRNLRSYLTKKNKKNFAFFIQSIADRPEILKKLSQEVTTFSVLHEVVPSQEVLKDILINEQITTLIQTKGFNPLQHSNVFYAEFGKLIELGYKALDSKPTEDKAREHYYFMKNYLELNQDHLPLDLCLTRLNDFSKNVFRNGFKDLSRDIFRYIVKKNVKSIQEDAIFFYMWTHLFTNEFKDALKLADSFKLLKNDAVIMDPRLRFWIGVAQEKTGDTKDAIRNYEIIIQNSPLSYYAIMSAKKLQTLSPTSAWAAYFKSEPVRAQTPLTIDLKTLDEDHLSSMVRLRAWAKIDNQKMLNLEVKRLNRHSMPAFLVDQPSDKQIAIKSDLHLINAKIIQESNNHLATFRYLYSVIDTKQVVFGRQVLEVLYPRPYYADLLKAMKKETILDPIVVLSLIRQESVFNPLARSPVGARGLMQLMPTTAKKIRRHVTDKSLVNPTINLELGTKYFKTLVKRYDGNLVYVLAAYNAGESRVERWKGLYFDTDETILKNIEAIPFLETRNYVKLIFRNIFFYKLLLEDEKSSLDPADANRIYDVALGFSH